MTRKNDTALAKPAPIDEGSVEILGPGALGALTSAEIDTQIATAKAHPRSITSALRQARELATLDRETARSMFYVVPRDGKKIDGPSVRLAEILAYAWGNIRIGGRVVDEGREFVTGQGFAFDLEKNVAVQVEVMRRITRSNGQRYGADMIATTGNAAVSIALRNAIFRVIPRSFVAPILKAAKEASVPDGKTMSDRRRAAFKAFCERGATEAQILAALGRKGPDDVSIDDLITLSGMLTAIEDGELTLEEAMRPPGSESDDGAKVQRSSIADKPAAAADENGQGQLPTE